MQLEISRVTNDAEHERALARLNAIWSDADDDAVDEVKILAMLIEDYENTRWPFELPHRDPIQVIKDAIEHAGHTRAHLVELLGSASRVSEILTKKRPLTLEMIRTISKEWGIPQEFLTPSYALAETVIEPSVSTTQNPLMLGQAKSSKLAKAVARVKSKSAYRSGSIAHISKDQVARVIKPKLRDDYRQVVLGDAPKPKSKRPFHNQKI